MDAWIDPTLAQSSLCLVLAAVLGGLVGFEREHTGAAAGLRTHMLVALGAALFTVAPRALGIDAEGASRVIAGIITGVGFLGAGTVLKRTEPPEIHGVTTAASIWVTAAVGMAVGAGSWQIAGVAVAITWLVLSVVRWVERRESARS